MFLYVNESERGDVDGDGAFFSIQNKRNSPAARETNGQIRHDFVPCKKYKTLV
jgi:hypothetical protein